MKDKKVIILEIIPTALNPKVGDIAQLSALKIDNLQLVDRFDYRLIDDKIEIEDIKNMISYDKEMFKYKTTTRTILSKFKKWIEDYDLLIIDNSYTEAYLDEIRNKKESVFKYLDMEFSDDVIEKIIEKYKLVPSNHIVDLLYEALIFRNGE